MLGLPLASPVVRILEDSGVEARAIQSRLRGPIETDWNSAVGWISIDQGTAPQKSSHIQGMEEGLSLLCIDVGGYTARSVLVIPELETSLHEIPESWPRNCSCGVLGSGLSGWMGSWVSIPPTMDK